jgi:hypothetical protein
VLFRSEIIINGVNYFAHELETTIEELEGVKVSYTAAFAVFDIGSKFSATITGNYKVETGILVCNSFGINFGR